MSNNIDATLISLIAISELTQSNGSGQASATSNGNGSGDSINMNALETGLLLNLAEHALENLENPQQNSVEAEMKQELKALALLSQMNSLSTDDDDDDDDTTNDGLFGNPTSNSSGSSNGLEQAFILGLAVGSQNGGSGNSSRSQEMDMIMTLMSDLSSGQSQGQSGVPSNATDADNGFNISSWGDPHITSSIDGQQTVSQKKQTNSPDLLTIDNTAGGSTTISTTETAVNSSGVNYNNTVDIKGGGSNPWDMHAIDNNGTMDVTDAGQNGSQTLQAGQTVNTQDGSTISFQNGQLTIAQNLTGGGSVTSTISDNGQGGLDVGSIGTGQAYISGGGVNLFNNSQKSSSGTSLTA